MSKLTVGELKEYLQGVIDELDEFDDDLEVSTTSNTYFIKSSHFLQFGNIGFVDLGYLTEDLEEKQMEADEDEDEDEEENENNEEENK